MPRPNRKRSIASEANLAKRIAYERESRGLSYEGLASLMTDRGCAIQGSAIYKIEKGDPPRRVTVDELVALKQVFEVSIDELLTPMELIEQRQAKELIEELDRVAELSAETAVRLFNMYTQYVALAVDNPELGEYVEHHWDAATEGDYPVAAITVDGATAVHDDRLNEIALKFSGRIIAMAREYFQEVAELAGENVIQAIEGGNLFVAVKGQVG